MTEVQDAPERSRLASIVTGTLSAALVGANLYLAWDWWRETPEGQMAIERWRSRFLAAKAKAEQCEGCAKRKAFLRASKGLVELHMVGLNAGRVWLVHDRGPGQQAGHLAGQTA